MVRPEAFIQTVERATLLESVLPINSQDGHGTLSEKIAVRTGAPPASSA